MPSNKNRVTSYLNDAEEKALKEFIKKEGISNSEAVNFLIRKQLIEKLPQSKSTFVQNKNAEKVEGLECQVRINRKLFDSVVQVNEKLEEQMAELRERVEHLYSENTKRNSEPITDEQIAAITNQPIWKVRLWRHGQIKPRGKRIKENLAPYRVEDGLWRKSEA